MMKSSRKQRQTNNTAMITRVEFNIWKEEEKKKQKEKIIRDSNNENHSYSDFCPKLA